jgi:glycosyltransferase involved in cell wall biosynthesis
VSGRPRLLFVAPWFLFPANTGGRIRTRDILRGLKGGRFEITLVSPGPLDGADYGPQVAGLCDRLVTWPCQVRGPLFRYSRLRYLASRLPIPVTVEWSAAGQATIDAELARRPDVCVVDFAHTAVFVPECPKVPSVLFTHNVEAQIFKRHAEVAANFIARAVWRNQWAKMVEFERAALGCFDGVVAVSEQDRALFDRDYGIADVKVISTGVDLDYFGAAPGSEPDTEAAADSDGETLVFTGSMDWMPNVDAVEFFMAEVWPRIVERRPGAKAVIVGRAPPRRLVEQARRRGYAIEFTGRVEDVRPYVRGAQVYVIPLRVGGGTRLKVFEAMAMGCPVVSTGIGVEGLPLERGRHYLQADTPGDFADAVLRLLDDPGLRARIAAAARGHVAANFSAGGVAKAFEAICAEVAGLDNADRKRAGANRAGAIPAGAARTGS